MKTAVLINEDLENMRLGLNTTLAYILAAVDLGHDVYLVDARGGGETFLLKKENCQNLIDIYKKTNENLLNLDQNSKKFVKDVKFSSQKVDFDINDCDLLVQRLDPTHEPFPPKGKEDYHDFLRKFLADKNIKNQNFNYPIDCYLDKELPVKMGLDIEVKSWISFAEDEDLVDKILKARDFSGHDKIVLKPDNSGQSMGVFAIEFVAGGGDFSDFADRGAEELGNLQIYHVANNLNSEELRKVVLFLLFCQSVKYNLKKDQVLNDREIIDGAKTLYNSKIVIQPFIEGVSKGDIRVSVMKRYNKFEVFGVIFRKSLQNEGNFTTCVTGNMALPVSINGELTLAEIEDLVAKVNKAVGLLNGDLSEKYARSFELGFDFILKGDGRTVLLNEVNHACPALLPVAERVRKFEGEISLYGSLKCSDFKYDGGLGILKEVVDSWLE